MDLINCTIPYGDLNISLIDDAEYCHVDNCTIKITKTSDELNIAYYNDQYLVSCDQKSTAVFLEVNDTTINNLCEPGKNVKPSLFIQIMKYFVTLLVVFVNISILIILVKQNKYTSLPIRLLLPSNIIWVVCGMATVAHNKARFTVKTPNGACITLLILETSSFQGANFIEMEVVFAIFYTFNRCYKLYSVLSEEATQKLFWRLIAVVFIMMTIFTISRVLVMIMQEAVYVTSDGYCKDAIDLYTVTPITQNIGVTFFTLVISTQILFTIFSGILLHCLSKNNNSR